MGQRKIPLDLEPVIAKAYLDGGSPSSMASEHGVTLTTIKNVLKRQGVYPRPFDELPPPKAGTPEYEVAVVELRQSGLRVRDIARRLKSATTTVSTVLQRGDVLPKWKRGENYKVTPEQAEEIERLYLEGLSTVELGRRFECNPRTIANVLKRGAVELRRRGAVSVLEAKPEIAQKALDLRAKGFSVRKIADSLNLQSDRPIRDLLHKCGLQPLDRGGPNHNRWSGGEVKASGGYNYIWVPPDHPFAAKMRTASGYILEHRLVMAEHLGRPLRRNETVHHINGDKTDNQIENLQLRQGKHGNHECFQCAECGSKNVVPIPL